jgi:hypothetical protein
MHNAVALRLGTYDARLWQGQVCERTGYVTLTAAGMDPVCRNGDGAVAFRQGAGSRVEDIRAASRLEVREPGLTLGSGTLLYTGQSGEAGSGAEPDEQSAVEVRECAGQQEKKSVLPAKRGCVRLLAPIGR